MAAVKTTLVILLIAFVVLTRLVWALVTRSATELIQKRMNAAGPMVTAVTVVAVEECTAINRQIFERSLQALDVIR